MGARKWIFLSELFPLRKLFASFLDRHMNEKSARAAPDPDFTAASKWEQTSDPNSNLAEVPKQKTVMPTISLASRLAAGCRNGIAAIPSITSKSLLVTTNSV